MKNRPPSSALCRPLKSLNPLQTTDDGRRTTPFLALCILLLVTGCGSKPKFSESKLPMPPGVDSGIYDGQFIQVDYGFGFPEPSKWFYLRLSADQEVDEVARFTDAGRQMIARVSVQIRDASEKFSAKAWGDIAEQDLKNHQFKIKKRDSDKTQKTNDAGSWIVVPFRVIDTRSGEWVDEEWALAKDDLLIAVHATLPAKDADAEKGKKLFKILGESLGKISWYTPIGPRGISVERFELQHFTEGFRLALESRSISKVGSFFDEMYPEKAKWNLWYQQMAGGDPKTFELRAELAGLIINGDFATATFSVIRKEKETSKSQKVEKSFKLSKKEGHWEIMSPIEKN